MRKVRPFSGTRCSNSRLYPFEKISNAPPRPPLPLLQLHLEPSFQERRGSHRSIVEEVLNFGQLNYAVEVAVPVDHKRGLQRSVRAHH